VGAPCLVWTELFSFKAEPIRGWDWFFSPLSLRDWLKDWLLPAAIESLLQSGHSTRDLHKLFALAENSDWAATVQQVALALNELMAVPPLYLKEGLSGFAHDYERIFATTPLPQRLRLHFHLRNAGEMILQEGLLPASQSIEPAFLLALCDRAESDQEALLSLRLLLAQD